jgi:hypothetical protein
VLLVPISLHSAWDNYEAKRLSRLVAEIRNRNEPITSLEKFNAGAESPQNAARYYEAAAALIDARDLYGVTGLLHRVGYATDAEHPQLLHDIRSWLERNREAEALLIRATDLPFEGYAAGTAYSYRADRLFKLATLAHLRTFERLEARQAEVASRSLVQQLRLNRPLTRSGPTELSITGISWAVTPALIDVARWLADRPSDQALLEVQQAIRETDDDTALEGSLLAERAFMLRNVWNESQNWYSTPRDVPNQFLWYVMRPLMARRFIQTIERMNRLLEHSRQPWPARLHVDVEDPPAGPSRSGPRSLLSDFAAFYHTLGSSYRSRARNIATALALARTANAAIAIERYRRANAGLPPTSLETLVPMYLDRVPTDPFSGVAIRYLRQPERVVVYSLGANEKDDGGVNVNYPVRQSGAFQARSAPPDLGVRLTVSSRR